jgi:hypothetical protein
LNQKSQTEEDFLPVDPPPLKRQVSSTFTTSNIDTTPQRKSIASSSINTIGNTNINDTSRAAMSRIATPDTSKRRAPQSVTGSSVRSTSSTTSLLTKLRSVRSQTRL